MNGRERIRALVAGQPVDHLPLMPITMQFAAARAGIPYRRYATDHRALVECQLRVAEDFGFAFVSSCYPYIAAPYLLDDETCEQVADEVAELLATFAECKARNEWPAFGDGFQLTGLRKWARRSQEVEVSFVED